VVAQEVSTELDELMESTLVRIVGLTVDSIVSTGASGWNLFGTNAQAVSYLIRLDSDVFSDVSPYEGQVIDVTGIVGQFDSEEPFTEGYQVTPGGAQDIQIQVSVKNLSKSAIAIVPNPVADIVHFDTDEVIQSIRIFSIGGQLVTQFETPNRTLNIAQLMPGEYVMTISTPNGLWSGTLVKL
jgi:hypothetical protein